MKRWSLFLIVVLFLSLVPVTSMGFVGAATPYVPIHDIQYTTDPSGNSPYSGETVITRGVVTAVESKGFFIQNETGAWNGIYVYLGSSPGVSVGDLVEVKGYVKEFWGLTELSVNPNYGDYVDVIGTAPLPDPVVLPTGDVSQEQWEGVLIKVEDVEVTDPDLGYGEWQVNDGSGNLVIDDLMYHYSPSMGQKFDYIIGVLYYSYGNFKLEPRNADDIKEYVPLIKIKSLEAPASAIRGKTTAITATLKNDGGFDENVTFLLSIDGSLMLNQTVKLMAGEEKSITYNWTPQTLGTHQIKAEISGYDTKYASVDVYENPSTVVSTFSRYYSIRYIRQEPRVNELYEKFTNLTGELEKYGVDLSPLKGDIEKIDALKKEMEDYHAQVLELSPYVPAYLTTKYFILTRKAGIAQNKLLEALNTIIPVLEEGLQNAKAGENVTLVSPTPVKVLIDNSHNQYYNSKQMLKLATNIGSELGWEIKGNDEPLTLDLLKEYDVVILPNPGEDITDEEAQALKEYVEEGGALLILGDWYKYVNADSLNKVVGEFGIMFNRDELMDEERNTGASYFPLIGEFNTHPAMKFLTAGDELYYNGDTLELSGNATWLIRGYETSYAVDGSGNIVKEKGSKPIVAAAVEVGKGRIVAYGSSKALSDAYYEHYIDSNWPFIKGVLLWLVGQS